MAGALAFGLSTYMIVGLSAGHNSRIGAIALMPLVMAGIHLCFSGCRILGVGVFLVGLALHLRENHLQITYYLIIIVLFYGLFQLIEFIRQKRIVEFGKNVGVLVPAVLIAAGTFFGQFWAITEYSTYSIRGKSDLVKPGQETKSGLSKDYAFQYKYGILEPMTLLIPEFYGGGSGKFLVKDRDSETFRALSSSGDQQLANQLVNFTSAYWGPQGATLAPYYAGAIMIFLFVIGLIFVRGPLRWWLLTISVLSIMMSWGDSFKAFNYFLFDHLPGYNKFRSHSFALAIILFAVPAMGMLGLEKLLEQRMDKEVRRKILIAFGVAGGLCLVFVLFAGMFSFTRDFEEGRLPAWFVNALAEDRESLMRSDAFRSFGFIAGIFILLYLDVPRRISPAGFYAFLAFMITADLVVVNKRYFTEDNYRRKRDNSFFAPTEADQEILKDKDYYRVYNLAGTFVEARTSYHHHSVGGYHGAKLRRYQDFYDSCLVRQTSQFYADAQSQSLDFSRYTAMNMLNTRYIVFGQNRENVIYNPAAYGNVWFVDRVLAAGSANEELEQTCAHANNNVAVIDTSRFTLPTVVADTNATINLVEYGINRLVYESNSMANGLAVFSEIYYPKGWEATIDGEPVPILRANYILRALAVPAGRHKIEFAFKPKPYTVGNKVTMASSWLTLLLVLACVGWSLKGTKDS